MADINLIAPAGDTACCDGSWCCSMEEPLHDTLANLLARDDVNDDAASAQAFAVSRDRTLAPNQEHQLGMSPEEP